MAEQHGFGMCRRHAPSVSSRSRCGEERSGVPRRFVWSVPARSFGYCLGSVASTEWRECSPPPTARSRVSDHRGPVLRKSLSDRHVITRKLAHNRGTCPRCIAHERERTTRTIVASGPRGRWLRWHRAPALDHEYSTYC